MGTTQRTPVPSASPGRSRLKKAILALTMAAVVVWLVWLVRALVPVL